MGDADFQAGADAITQAASDITPTLPPLGTPAAPPSPEPPSTQRIPVVSPDGKYGTIDASDRAAAESAGYRFPSEAELAQQKYGSFPQEALGAAETVAGSATADLSKLAETKLLGVSPEDIEGREEALGPVGRFAAGGIGFGTLYALTGGLGAGLEAAGPLTEALGGSRALAAAASMGAYAAGQSVDDQMIGPAPFSAEAVLEDAGIGAVLGGATEGLLGLAGRQATSAIGSAKVALGNIDELGQRALTRTLVAGGADEQSVAAGLRISQEAAEAGMTPQDFLRVQGEKDGVQAAHSAADLDSRVAEAMYGGDDSDGFVKDRYKAVERALEGQPVEAAFDGADRLMEQIGAQIKEADANPNAYGYRPIAGLGAATRIRGMLGDLAESAKKGTAAGTPAAAFSNAIGIIREAVENVTALAPEGSRVMAAGEGAVDILSEAEGVARVRAGEDAASVASEMLGPGHQGAPNLAERLAALSGDNQLLAKATASAARAFDREVGWDSVRSSIVKRASALLDEFSTDVEAQRLKMGTPSEPGAMDIWKTGDRLRQDSASAIRDWGAESRGAYKDASAFGERIAGIAASFTKDDQAFGPSLHRAWSVPQEAFRNWMGARSALLSKMGEGTADSERAISSEKFLKFLTGLAKDRTGDGTLSGRIFDEYMGSTRDLIDSMDKAYQTMPNAPAPSRATLESLVQAANDAKVSALQKMGLGAAIDAMKGGSTGSWWLPAYIARQFGVAEPALPFVVGAYKLGKLVTRPRAAIEAYGQLARIVSKLRGKIGVSAKAAAKALTAADYGMRGSIGNALHEHIQSATMASILGRAAAASMADGSRRHAEELANIGTDPTEIGSRLGHAWSSMPPDTADAGVRATMREIAVRRSVQPPARPIQISDSDAMVHGLMLDAIHRPVEALLGGLADGFYDPTRAAVARAARPEIAKASDAALLDELSKLKGLGEMNPYARGALNLHLGGHADPDGMAESAQASYAQPSAPGSQGLPNGVRAGDISGGSRSGLVRKFKSDLAQREGLPIDRTWKPT